MKRFIRLFSLALSVALLAIALNVNAFAEETDDGTQPDENILMGDVNGDGVIDTNDSIIALQMAANIVPENSVADMDADGYVSVKDARAILRLALYPPKPSDPETPSNPEGGEETGGVVIPDQNGENVLSDDKNNPYIQLIAQRFNVDPASLVAIYSEPDTGTNYVLQFKKSGGKYEKSVDNLQRVYHIGAAPEREISYTNGKLLFGEHYNCDSGTGVLVFNLVQTQVMPQYPDYFTGV
jgi:hypothetical protein